MLMSKGIAKLEKMGGFSCNGICHHCVYEQALKSTGNGMDVYRALYRDGAISAKQYRIVISELEEEYFILDKRCNKHKEKREKLSNRI